MTRRSRILMRRLHEREIETSIARSIPAYAGFFPAYPTPATRPRCSRRADLQGGHPCLVVGDDSSAASDPGSHPGRPPDLQNQACEGSRRVSGHAEPPTGSSTSPPVEGG